MYKEQPGDARGSALAYQQQMVRMAQQFVRFEQILERMFEDDEEVTGMSIRVPNTEGADYLVTVRSRCGNENRVAFHSGASFAETVRGMVARLENRSLRWKADEYANGR